MERWFKSNPLPLQFAPDKIDREAGIIRDVVMAQAGPAKGHGVHLEESFIANLIAYDQQNYSNTGLKARFGHPSMSNTTMGTQLGYFRNFRQDGEKAVADLHLLESADKSPTSPGMREWMLSMAEEATDFVMSSIVFLHSGHYQYDPETGARVELDASMFGEPEVKFQNERVFVAFDASKGAAHLYTDLVEAGAATDALFSQQFNTDKFAVRTVAWLQENDDILTFIRSNPHKIIEMCESLNINLNMKKTKENFFSYMAAFFTSDAEHTPEVVETPDLPVAEPVAEYVEPVAEVTPGPDTVEDPEPEDRFAAIETALTALQESNKQLAAENEALRKKHQADPATYQVEVAPADRSLRYQCATTRRAMGRK